MVSFEEWVAKMRFIYVRVSLIGKGNSNATLTVYFQHIGWRIVWCIGKSCRHSVIQTLFYSKNLDREARNHQIWFLILGLEILE